MSAWVVWFSDISLRRMAYLLAVSMRQLVKTESVGGLTFQVAWLGASRLLPSSFPSNLFPQR